MADIQVRCTLKSAAGIPAHDCINTFAVKDAEPGVDDGIIAPCFSRFYNEVGATSGLALGSFINDTILRTEGLLVELVESPQTPPNAPYAVFAYDLVAPDSNPIPQEVAIVLSMQDASYGSSLQPGRHRGRVYIGPLTVDAMTDSGLNAPARPSSNVKSTIIDAAQALGPELSAGDRAWAIWSRSSVTFTEVVGGWLDNEFDTQRRRGQFETGRTFWST